MIAIQVPFGAPRGAFLLLRTSAMGTGPTASVIGSSGMSGQHRGRPGRRRRIPRCRLLHRDGGGMEMESAPVFASGNRRPVIGYPASMRTRSVSRRSSRI